MTFVLWCDVDRARSIERRNSSVNQLYVTEHRPNMFQNAYRIRGTGFLERCADASKLSDAWRAFIKSHNGGSGSRNIDGMVVGGVRQYPAAAVASGAAFRCVPAKFSNTVAAKDVLHTDRINMTNLRYDIRISQISYFTEASLITLKYDNSNNVCRWSRMLIFEL